MTLAVLTALPNPWESELVAAMDRAPGLRVARRCSDLRDLLAAASAGVGDIALVSADLRSLDRSALDHLARHGVVAAGAVAPGDEAAERRLRQLGVLTIVTADAETHELDDALARCGTTAGGGPPPTPPEDPADPSAARTAGPPPTGGAAAPPTTAAARVVAVWGPAGAPGRTTLALTLATELAAAGRTTLLLDCDTYGASLGQCLALLDEAPGMAAAARASEQGVLDVGSLARMAPEALPRVRVLTGIPRADRWPELRAAAVADVVRTARQLAEFVIIDCGFSIEDDEELSYDTAAPRRNAATLASLEAADDLWVVGAADPVGLQRLVRAVQDLATVPAPPPRVVVNKVRAGAVGPQPERRIAEALARFGGMEVVAFLPWDPLNLDAAMLAGRALAEVAPESALRRAVRALASSEADGVGPSRRARGRRRR